MWVQHSLPDDQDPNLDLIFSHPDLRALCVRMRGNCRSGLLVACFRELKPSLCLTPDACALPSIARLPFKPIISRRMRVCFAQENGGEVGASGSGATGGRVGG